MAETLKTILINPPGGTELQWLEYYDFIGLNNPLSGILSVVVDGPPFLRGHGKINCFEPLSGAYDPTLFCKFDSPYTPTSADGVPAVRQNG
jgi:hypothetical protein